MTTHVFRIPGEPAGWRNQSSVVRGKPRHRLAKPAAHWQGLAVAMLAEEWGDEPALTGPLHVGVEAVFARPKRLECSHQRKPCSCSQRILLGLPEPHVGTPDATNLLKLAEDALTRAGIIEDDRFVCQGERRKRYAARGEPAHTRIEVWEVAT